MSAADRSEGDAIRDERIRDVRLWAAEQGCVLELDGEVGFGRPCVGILWRDHYVDTPGSAYNDVPPGLPREPFRPDERQRRILDLYRPPDDVDAYEKHDCLAVLGTDELAVDGLLRWVEKIRAVGGRIVVQDRDEVPGTRDIINLMLHGTRYAVVEFPEGAA